MADSTGGDTLGRGQITSCEPGTIIPADGTSSSVPITATGVTSTADEEKQAEVQVETSTRFNVGDAVVLVPGTRYYHQAPDNRLGIITEIRQGSDLIYQIRWENGHINAYGEEDVTAAPGIMREKGRGRQSKIGRRVKGVSPSMRHYNYTGYIDKIDDYGERIWVKWADGELTHIQDISLIIIPNNIKCPEPQPLKCDTCPTPCRIEIQRKKKIDKEQREKEAIEQEIIKKREKYKDYYKTHTIKISIALHAFLLEELVEFQLRGNVDYPFMYLLGINKNGVITEAHPLRGSGGCKDMQTISIYEIKLIQKRIFKEKLKIAGIGRVGRFVTDNYEGINDISDMSSNAILLSINKENIWAHKWLIDGHYRERIQIGVNIINKRMKGGEKDGGSSKSKENKEADISDVGGVG